ncbi:hypothetical protein KK062_15630 [Fulvivirgaceae bacterium PWU5]|uniref:Outer membrane protein beta-barrel domain-containing protein n=1 Tax=Dawidia cretensis TaxID=2782350 RepID=A0AAP2DYE8_9BACT|nr:hypothetical protein [Dawidia cretensis]MBT1709673.1 hypothetical protein [Dawidia cretensis]
MKTSIRLAVSLIFIAGVVFQAAAQDEGVITKKERIGRSKGIFIDIGPSWTLGKNIGDYKAGANFEIGYQKRLNRVLSIGPSLSFLQFDYDPGETGINNAFIGGPFNNGNGPFYEGIYYELEGGDLSLVSLSMNIKLNLIPVRDNSVVSAYVFAKPFISYVTRTEVTGTMNLLFNYGDLEDETQWQDDGTFDRVAGEPLDEPFDDYTVSDELKEQDQVTGGIFIGPGLEFFPARKFTGFVQVSIGYTFPVSFVSTESYSDDQYFGNDFNGFMEKMQKYPITKEGFPSVNLQFGVSFNF